MALRYAKSADYSSNSFKTQPLTFVASGRFYFYFYFYVFQKLVWRSLHLVDFLCCWELCCSSMERCWLLEMWVLSFSFFLLLRFFVSFPSPFLFRFENHTHTHIQHIQTSLSLLTPLLLCPSLRSPSPSLSLSPRKRNTKGNKAKLIDHLVCACSFFFP